MLYVKSWKIQCSMISECSDFRVQSVQNPHGSQCTKFNISSSKIQSVLGSMFKGSM